MYGVFLRDRIPECQCAMEMWKRDVVPAETSCGACFESRIVVLEVGDDHFDNLRRETALLGTACGGTRVLVSEDAREFSFGTTPNGDCAEGPNPWNRLMRRCDGKRNKVGLAVYLAEKMQDFLEVFRRGLSSTWACDLKLSAQRALVNQIGGSLRLPRGRFMITGLTRVFLPTGPMLPAHHPNRNSNASF